MKHLPLRRVSFGKHPKAFHPMGLPGGGIPEGGIPEGGIPEGTVTNYALRVISSFVGINA